MSIGTWIDPSESKDVQDFFSLPGEKNRDLLLVTLSQVAWEKPLERWLSSWVFGGVKIRREASGKPFLESSQEVFLSVSTLSDAVLVGIARQQIGIDAEKLSRRVSCLEIARRYFSAVEFDWIQETPDETDRRRRFFSLWTAREASVKLDGCGIVGGFAHWVPLAWSQSPPTCTDAALKGRKICLSYPEVVEGVVVAVAAFMPPGTVHPVRL